MIYIIEVLVLDNTKLKEYVVVGNFTIITFLDESVSKNYSP